MTLWQNQDTEVESILAVDEKERPGAQVLVSVFIKGKRCEMLRSELKELGTFSLKQKIQPLSSPFFLFLPLSCPSLWSSHCSHPFLFQLH